MKRLCYVVCTLLLISLVGCGFTEQDKEIIIDTLKDESVGILSEESELVTVQTHRYWGLFPGTESFYIYSNPDDSLVAIRYKENKEQEDEKDYTYKFLVCEVEEQNPEEIVEAEDIEKLENYYYTHDDSGDNVYYEVPPYIIGDSYTYYISKKKSFLSYTYKVWMEFN